jgi:hypothetical protein
MDDFARVDSGNVNLINTKDRPAFLGKVIKKVYQTESKDGGSVGLELHAKQPALELIAKIHGWVVEKKELTGKDGEALKVDSTVEVKDELTGLLKDPEAFKALLVLEEKCASAPPKDKPPIE